MAAKKKHTAEDRTISMFGGATSLEERTAAAVAAEAELEAGEKSTGRVPVEEDVNRLRDAAFTTQEWTTKHFGSFEAPGNEYRCSKRGRYYFVETIMKMPGAATAYGHTGVIVHERDIMELTKIMVAAVREKQAADAKLAQQEFDAKVVINVETVQ